MRKTAPEPTPRPRPNRPPPLPEVRPRPCASGPVRRIAWRPYLPLHVRRAFLRLSLGNIPVNRANRFGVLDGDGDSSLSVGASPRRDPAAWAAAYDAARPSRPRDAVPLPFSTMPRSVQKHPRSGPAPRTLGLQTPPPPALSNGGGALVGRF